jgi:hypothetical protein
MIDVTGIRLKLDRAKAHLDFLNADVREVIEGDDPNFVADFNPAKEGHEFKIARVLTRPNWPVIVGDFVHNARSALDHLAWQLVLDNGERPGIHTKFPIEVTEAAWLNQVANRATQRGLPPLAGVSQEAFDLIRAAQPYQGRDEDRAHRTELARLNAMWNTDKHRTLHITRTYMPGVKPTVTVTPFGVATILHEAFLPPGAPIDEKTVVALIQVGVRPGTTDEADVRVHLELPTSVAFGEEGKPPVPIGALPGILFKVEDIVAALS